MTINNTNDNPSREPPILATSFRRDEVELACTIFAKASVGEDVRIMARSAAAQGLHKKFLAMREKARRAEAGG